MVTNRSDFVLYTVPDKGSDKDCKRLRAVTERVFCEEFLSGGKDLFKIQVLSPLRSKTQASVDELNIVLQKIANPKISENEEINFGRAIFRKGDKVMQSCNDYDKGVFNGDIGIIKLVSSEKKILQVDFQCGYRPAIIVQNNVRNECSTNVIVVPMTSQPKRRMPTHVIVDTDTGIPRKSVALCEQIQTIQKTRLIRKLGEIKSSEVFANIQKAMKIALAMNDR